MNRTLKLSLLCFLFLSILPPVLLGQHVSLTILHTNDTHGHLLPFSYPAVAPPGSELAGLKTRTNIGGVARRATLVGQIRKDLEARGAVVWLVDVGDFSEGTPFSSEYHGEADIAAMNAMGYDFATIGNHEFNNPLSRLKSLIGQFKFPVLCANAVDKATGKPLAPPSAIREVGSLRIGIFGITSRESGGYRAGKEGVIVDGELETAERMVKELRPQADIVIAISHSGENLDRRIADKVNGLDVIVGGHSHTRLPDGGFVWRSEELKAAEVNGTIIVQAHQWGGELGRLDLLFSKDDKGAWHVDRYRARLIPITPDIHEEKTLAALVDRYWKPIASKYGEIIGRAADDFSERGGDLAPYNLVSDLVREVYGTEIHLENMGGIRAPLIKGDITKADLINMDPFDNRIVTFKLTGLQLKEILRRYRPAVSGLRYRVENGEIKELSIGGQPAADERVYSGSTNTYLAERALKTIPYKDTGKVRLDVVTEYIRKKGTVTPQYDGRRVVIEPERAGR